MIKQIRVKDQQLLCDIAKENLNNEWLSSFFTVANIKKVIKENGFKFIGYYDDELKGFIAYNPKNYQLGFVMVDKRYQYTGIGRCLLDWYEEECKVNNVKIIESNVFDSVGFFEKCGFEIKNRSEALCLMQKMIKDELLGKTVNVIVEQPYGSLHPMYDEELTVNTGFIKEVFDETGEFIKTYVYGANEPLESFKGVVIGIIHTKEEEKRAIVASAPYYDRDKVINDIAFEMQHHDMYIEWLKGE